MAYFSNSSEGSVLDNQCIDCKLSGKPCIVLFVQMEYNYDQIGNNLAIKIMNDLIDENGICLMKKLIDGI